MSDSRVQPGIHTGCSNYPIGPTCAQGDVACSTIAQVGGGHGTHVAGIVGGRTFGLAKDVNPIPVKALCSGYSMTLQLRGIEWILDDRSLAEPTAIVNISGLNGLGEVLGPSAHCSYYDPSCPDGVLYREAMISLASRDNLLVVQSARNQSFSAIPFPPGSGYYGIVDACEHSFGDEASYSNAAEREAIGRIIVAGGTDENDGLWRSLSGEYGDPFGSNAGGCVDIFAPAARIASAFYMVNSGSVPPQEVVCQLSGTSMAAPHVAGVAAMILQSAPNMNAKALRTMVLNFGETGHLESNSAAPDYIGTGSPNLLIHWDPTDIARDGFETGSFVAWEVSP